MPHIRPFEKKDSKSCCNIINAAIQHMDGLNDAARNFIMVKNTPEILYAELSNYYILIYEKNNEILGLGALDRNEIKRSYIDPKAQRKGIGSKIIEQLEQEAKKRDVQIISTQASPSSESFYKTLGYTTIQKEQMKKDQAIFEFVTMEKKLIELI